MLSTDPLAQIRELTFMLADPPPPDRAMARIEIVTCGGSTRLTMPAIKVEHERGVYTATIEDAGLTWTGKADSLTAAIIVLLADRAGYKAIVMHKEDR